MATVTSKLNHKAEACVAPRQQVPPSASAAFAVPARSDTEPLSPLQIKPHPHFMLFATQNPPGTYGGRKVCCRLTAASHAARCTRNAWDANLLVLWETPPSGGH